MDINMNPSRIPLAGSGNLSPLESADRASGIASTAAAQNSAATGPALTISNRENISLDPNEVEEALPAGALDRNDALGQLVTSAFNFSAPPPKIPDGAE